jgi:hypothetical protein
VKHADDLVLLVKGELALQDMIDKLIEIGRSYGMEMIVEKTKVMRISRKPFPVNCLESFEMCAGEGWRRSVGPSM